MNKIKDVTNIITRAIEEININMLENNNIQIKKITEDIDDGDNINNLIEQCRQSLIEINVWKITYKTFVYEFHEFRKKINYPISTNSSIAYNHYINNISAETLIHWFNKYPYLREIIEKIINNICEFSLKVCHDLITDWNILIEKNLINKGEKLQNITCLDSDPHNNNKVGLCFDFEKSKVLYKPKSLKVDMLISEIFENILQFEELNKIIPVATSIDRGDYGWQRFINRNYLNKDDLPKAFYNLGLCSSLFTALGATDLHDENIIFNNEYPYFIDLETCLQPEIKYINNSLVDTMLDNIKSSIASTSIIPSNIISYLQQILVGAINTPYPQKTNKRRFSLKNFGTDAMDIAKENVTVNHLKSSIKLTEGEASNPLPYQFDFLEGFSKGYKRVLEKSDSIKKLLNNHSFTSRVIIRPTDQYYLVLDAIIYPENLKSEKNVDNILDYLKPTKLVKDRKIALDLLKEEKKAIKKGDIPFFYTYNSKHNLKTQGYTTGKAFELTPVDNINVKLNNLSNKRKLLNFQFIAEGFSYIKLKEAEYFNEDNILHFSPLFKNTLKKTTINNPYPIIDLLLDLSITTNSEIKKTGWFNGMYGNMPSMYNSMTNFSLHDTGGVIFLLEHIKDFRQNPSLVKLDFLNSAKLGLQELQEYFFNDKTSNYFSIISGKSSIDFIFDYKNEKSDNLEKAGFDCCFTKKGNDVFNGTPGLGLVLSSFPLTSSDILFKILSTMVYDGKNHSKKGIAHGELGILWSKYRINKFLKRKDTCKKLFEEVKNITYSLTGWCCGNAGLLMVLAEMCTELNVEKQFLKSIAKKAIILSNNEPIDLSVCHGASGVLQSLLFTYRATNDEWYLSLANTFWQKVLDLSKKNGFYTGEKNRDYILGYFLGWSGFADSCLLLAQFNNKKKPWIPLNLSSSIYQENL
ncbi:Lantibiotic modifying enzyme [Staphylococcus aureus]|nr:Lantibiotic modifying enzyme [Staphylococcus aureus]